MNRILDSPLLYFRWSDLTYDYRCVRLAASYAPRAGSVQVSRFVSAPADLLSRSSNHFSGFDEESASVFRFRSEVRIDSAESLAKISGRTVERHRGQGGRKIIAIGLTPSSGQCGLNARSGWKQTFRH
jgi:hypothetical protein